MRPWFITTTRSASSSASSWSWVTKTLVTCSSSCSRRSQRRSSLRTLASSAPNGSSSSSTRGSTASARASATRWRWPPESWRGIAVGEPVELHQLEQLVDASRGSRPRGGRCAARPHAQAEGDVLEHGHVAEQRVVLEHEADLALAHVRVGGVLAVEAARCPRSAHSSPAMMRSSVVLPEPDGPSSATSSPGRTSRLTSSQRGEAAEALADVLDCDAHAVASFSARRCRRARRRRAIRAWS